jgi:hypothetical protein
VVVAVVFGLVGAAVQAVTARLPVLLVVEHLPKVHFL